MKNKTNKEIIVFLDVDGVIATNNSIDNLWKEYMGEAPDNKFEKILNKKNLPFINTSMSHWPFDRNCISNIHKFQLELHEQGHIVNYVISSTWKSMGTIEELKDLFNMKGLYLTKIIGKTSRVKMSEQVRSDSPRGKEILQWLKDNNKEDSTFIVIDDDIDYDIIQYIEEKHCIKTEFKDGFTDGKRNELLNKLK